MEKFDTLEAYQKLRDAGMPPEQACAVAALLCDLYLLILLLVSI